MSLGLVFWILMLLWVAFGVGWNRESWAWPMFGNWFLFILLLLLGWKAFGAPIHG